MADQSAAPWYPTAAYLYVLHLDDLALAWEYLRRHPDYRRDWLRRRHQPDTACSWGLRMLEDPAVDARDAHPAWLPGHPCTAQITRTSIHRLTPQHSSSGAFLVRSIWFMMADA